MEEPDHSHPVDIHLAFRVFEGRELERTSYPHTGVVDENVDAPFSIQYLPDCGFAVSGGLYVRADIGDSRQEILCLAVRSVYLVPVGTQPLRHGAAESGGYACDEDDHVNG